MILPRMHIVRFNHHVFNEEVVGKYIARMRLHSFYFCNPIRYLLYDRGVCGEYAVIGTDSLGELCLQVNPIYIKDQALRKMEASTESITAESSSAKTELNFILDVVKGFTTKLLTMKYGEETVKKLSGAPVNPFKQQMNIAISDELNKIQEELRRSMSIFGKGRAIAKEKIEAVCQKFKIEL